MYPTFPRQSPEDPFGNKEYKLKIVTFFISINILFYWIAMIAAFPELLFGNSSLEYFLLQFPVGILGGFFDSLS